MPNIDSPPPAEGVDTFLVESSVRSKNHVLIRLTEASPKRHEVEYMKRHFDYKDFRYAAYYGIDNPWRRTWFLLRHFPQFRWEKGKAFAFRLTLAALTIAFFIFI